MSASPRNILSQIDKTVGHPEEMREIEGKRDDYELTPEGAKSESNHHSSHGVLGTGISQIALVEPTERETPKECWGARHTLVFWGLLAVALTYSMRVNLSVAIIAMVKRKPKNVTNTKDVTHVCLPPDQYDSYKEENEKGEFEWDEATQGQVLGVFYYSYLVTTLFGGRAAEHFGGKLILGWGVVFTGIFTVLSPLCAKVSTGLFIVNRTLQGLSQGFVSPAMTCLLAKWVPPVEKAKFTSLVLAGAQLGTVVSMTVSGWLCDTDFLDGWPSVFYIFGALGIVLGIPWYFFVYSKPDLHPRISIAEKVYINKSCVNSSDKEIPIPWKAIFTSTPFWAIFVVHFGYSWGFYTLLTMLPTYLNDIQHFDLKSNGLWSALPYLIMWILSIFYGNLMSHLQATGKLSTITIRRLAMAIGMYGSMLALVAMCFVDCNQILAIVVICAAVGLCGSVYSGYNCSHQDISPNLAGTLMSFTNVGATTTGFLAPGFTGLIINGNQTLSAWRTVFLISSVMYMVAGTFYIFFISAEIQSWNFPKRKIDDEASEREKENSGQPS